MGTDKPEFNRTMPAQPMYYDTEFLYMQDRNFWLKVLLGLGLLSYGFDKY